METKLLVGGEQVAGTGGELDVINPTTEEVLATLNVAGADQIDAAVASAAEAARNWGHVVTAGERTELLKEVGAWLRANQTELARTMTLEGGKPLIENSDEVEWTWAAFEFYAELSRSSQGRVIPPIESTQLAMVIKEPIGVVGCIVPWNYPLLLLAWKLAPALAAGNCCVCKASELTPLSILALAAAFENFPKGVVSLLAGAGDVGQQIVSDERVGCVAFTGSVPTGKSIAVQCAKRVARANLELGGKDAFIVCGDVAGDIETVARGGAWAAYLNAGQVCTSAERFYVHKDVYDPFVEHVVEHAKSLRLGDPLKSTTDVGPMVNAAQRDKVIAQLENATGKGAEILIGGTAGQQKKGFFMEPAVVVGVKESTSLLREETFGPVVPIVKVDSLDEAIALANSNEFGLGANVYTRDLRNAMRCLRELRAGTVWINDPLTDNDAGPFGGFKQSGEGRELGVEGLEAFQETKHVHMESVLEAKDWWYPYGD
jgi:betaine-aldehyde dehydrogenase